MMRAKAIIPPGGMRHCISATRQRPRQSVRRYEYLESSRCWETDLTLFGDSAEHCMLTTVTLDYDLLAKAVKLTGERESAARLAKLGGTPPKLESMPRRCAAAA